MMRKGDSSKKANINGLKQQNLGVGGHAVAGVWNGVYRGLWGIYIHNISYLVMGDSNNSKRPSKIVQKSENGW
jgi:hypothetical protein